MKLRPFQDDAINRIRQAIRQGHKRILVVAPTGAGKTVIGAHMMNATDIKGNRSLFFAHRRELVLQTADKLHRFDCPHAFVMSGMDRSVMTRTQVASIQTFHSWIKNEKWNAPWADVVFADEAHLSLSMMWQKMFNHYSGAIKIGLTATPCRGDGRGLGDAWDVMVEVSTVQELMDLGYLIPIRIYAPTVPDLTGVHIKRGDYVEDELDEVMNTSDMVGSLVSEWAQRAKGEKTVAFAVSIGHAKFIAELFKRHGHKAEYIDGTMDLEKRGRLIEGHKKGEFDILANCNIVVEGYDDPEISCIIDAAPTKSYGRQLQKYGRGLRPKNGEKALPGEYLKYIDHAGNVYRHGYPEEAGYWSLDPDVKVQDRKKEAKKKDPQPVTCRICYTVYQGQSECPNCGNTPTRRATEINMKEGRLREVPKVKKEKSTKEQKQEFWNKCLYQCKHRGRSTGVAAHMYKHKFGVWPKNLDRLPRGKAEWNMKAEVFLDVYNNRQSSLPLL